MDINFDYPDTTQIYLRLQSGSLELFETTTYQKSEAWIYFRHIRDIATKRVVFGLVVCKECFTVVIWKIQESNNIKKYSTSSLFSHIKSCPKINNTSMTKI